MATKCQHWSTPVVPSSQSETSALHFCVSTAIWKHGISHFTAISYWGSEIRGWSSQYFLTITLAFFTSIPPKRGRQTGKAIQKTVSHLRIALPHWKFQEMQCFILPGQASSQNCQVCHHLWVSAIMSAKYPVFCENICHLTEKYQNSGENTKPLRNLRVISFDSPKILAVGGQFPKRTSGADTVHRLLALFVDCKIYLLILHQIIVIHQSLVPKRVQWETLKHIYDVCRHHQFKNTTPQKSKKTQILPKSQAPRLFMQTHDATVVVRNRSSVLNWHALTQQKIHTKW